MLNEKTKTDPCPDGERCTDQAACKYYHTKLDQMPKIFFKERYCRIWQVRRGQLGTRLMGLLTAHVHSRTCTLLYLDRQLPQKLGSRPVCQSPSLS